MTLSTRWLVAAQLVTATVLGFLGQLLTGSGATYFGPPDQITAIGWGYLAALGLLLVVSLAGLATGAGWSRAVAVLIPTLNVAAFVQPIIDSPTVAGTILLWNLWLIGRLVAPPGALPALTPIAPPHTLDPVARAARHLLGASALTNVVIVGYEHAEHPAVWVACGGLATVALATAFPFVLARYRAGAWWPWAVPVIVLAAIAASANAGAALLLLSLAQLVVLVAVWAADTRSLELQQAFFDHPALLVLTSFVALIVVGTLLLSFPVASTTAGSIGIVDAAFTAASAVCVTGLIVLDTPGDFTTFGHAVILVLIQVGGLNIMVLSTFGAILLGRGLGLRGERALGEMLDVRTPESIYRLIAFIVTATFAIEAAGAGALTLAYWRDGVALTRAMWLGTFHAVSAFCNAGFALHSDSLQRFADEPLVLGVFAALITAGGLGFVVLAGAVPRLRTHGLSRLRVHTRMVLWASVVLVLGGAVAYAAGEWDRSLAGLSPGDRWVNALFQSVTLRTAGFNSVPLEIAPATSLWMMALMFIGASPGGTGGGIKTTTAVLLLAAIPTIVAGRGRTVLGGRTISAPTMYRSAAIATVSALLVLVGALLVLSSQQGTFQSLLFEVFSAVGTVGLSLGATTTLDPLGKTVIIGLMLVGRIGPLSLALLLARRSTSRIDFPEATVIVG